MSRFYIEGDEIDVQDPTFFLPIETASEMNENLENYLADYA